jgi:DNA-directed RNA polymerase specialized sigma24 family protein
MPEKLYTTGEVAKIFGVSYVAVKKRAYSGKIH